MRNTRVFVTSFLLCCIYALLSITDLKGQEVKTKSLQKDSISQKDTTAITYLQSVVFTQSARKKALIKPLPAVIADPSFMHRHLSGVWVASLAQLPGVRAMNIGNGFGKPVIRGLGFNRVAYVEGDIKQESQQWGSDHGLEVDAFDDAEVTVVKGPRSLLYGSDALAGAIISGLPVPTIKEGFQGELTLLGTSINGGFGGSFLGSYKKGNHFARIRYSEQHFGDMDVNTDSITYLTIKIPIYKRRMKNTAGYNRAVKASYEYRNGGYSAFFMCSDVYEKVGFFPGAHGIPDMRRLKDDYNRYNVDLPYSNVNHLKLYMRHAYTYSDLWSAVLTTAFQRNFRQEWSLFHTHYPSQPVPKKDPNKELQLDLKTFSARADFSYYGIENLRLQAVADADYKYQTVAGYGFLVPPYNQANAGLGLVAEYKPFEKIAVEGGIRGDVGHMHAKEETDPYLDDYLHRYHFSQKEIDENRIRSAAINRYFSALTGSIGVRYTPNEMHNIRFNIGRGFRFPEINELACNGIHHGSFRHERGDVNLKPEEAWQANLSYDFTSNYFQAGFDAFFNYFDNYIYQTPTGIWSILPHAGQIYEFRQNKALLTGGELTAKCLLPYNLSLETAADYVYTYNIDKNIPLPLTPPLRWRTTFCWKPQSSEFALTYRFIGDANRVVPGEDHTKGASLFDLYAEHTFLVNKLPVTLSFTVSNLFNTVYMDHLSFYRRINLPEAGRNFRVSLRIPL